MSASLHFVWFPRSCCCVPVAAVPTNNSRKPITAHCWLPRPCLSNLLDLVSRELGTRKRKGLTSILMPRVLLINTLSFNLMPSPHPHVRCQGFADPSTGHWAAARLDFCNAVPWWLGHNGGKSRTFTCLHRWDVPRLRKGLVLGGWWWWWWWWWWMWGQLYSNMSTGWRLGTDVQPSARAIDHLIPQTL